MPFLKKSDSPLINAGYAPDYTYRPMIFPSMHHVLHLLLLCSTPTTMIFPSMHHVLHDYYSTMIFPSMHHVLHLLLLCSTPTVQ